MSDLVATFTRRTTGVEVSVTGAPEEAAAEFERLCQEFDTFPGYGGKKSPEDVRRAYAIRSAVARKKAANG